MKYSPEQMHLIDWNHSLNRPLNAPDAAKLNHEINEKDLKTHVLFLSSEALGGRLTGSVGEKLATQYVAFLFQYFGLEPAGDNGTYFQEFNFSPAFSTGKKKSPQPQKQRGRNVLAKLKLGQDSCTKIIIGAHADHLGHGELSGSLARKEEKGFIHYGADDNASGVASLLAVAVKLRHLKERGELNGNKDILFAVWSGEEYGILGSTHFLKNLKRDGANELIHSEVAANINLDMVGRLREHLILQGTGSSSMWPELIKRANVKYALPLIIQSDPYLPTDSTSFYLQGVPTINFFTGAHEEYHSPRDTPETLNYEGIKNISNFLVELVFQLENETKGINYQEVKKTDYKTGGGFKVYLGTIPDYASEDVLGVKLSGVTKGSPAEKAGLRQDDVIVELAGTKIHTIYDYSAVIKTLHGGEKTTLIVQRGQNSVALNIIPTSRS